jgi:hypothetical protein
VRSSRRMPFTHLPGNTKFVERTELNLFPELSERGCQSVQLRREASLPPFSRSIRRSLGSRGDRRDQRSNRWSDWPFIWTLSEVMFIPYPCHVKIATKCAGEFDLASGTVLGKQSWAGDKNSYAAFFACALTFAHRARCAAAILFLPAADIVRLRFGARTFAFDHRVFSARLIRLRAEADNVRLGLV